VSNTVNRLLIAYNARMDESNVLQAVPSGLEHMDEIKFAVLERTGEISIIPKRQKKG
jgi:uncharacterized membrane protein YcaP (DUF421 family)